MRTVNERSRVYFAQCDFGGPIKIGFSVRPEKRVATFNEHVPFPVVEIGSISGGAFLERFFHLWFRDQRIKGEWFQPTAELWRAALEARTTNAVHFAPLEPNISYSLSSARIRCWFEHRRISTATFAKICGVETSTVDSYLKIPEFCRPRLLAAIACVCVRSGIPFDPEEFVEGGASRAILDMAA